jgi:monovalent cation/proton antiporter MnhG/PhaG subunit
MSTGTIAISVLLAICVIVTAVCCVALILVKDIYNRMHYLAPVASISILALLAAVAIQEGWGQATLKTVLILIALFLVNAVLTHATARAARIRQFGHWLPNPQENIKNALRPSELPTKEPGN